MLILLFALSLLPGTQEDAEAGQSPTSGVYLNSNGSPLMTLIPSAQSTLDIEIYTMGDVQFRGLLRDALARNVKVRIVKEPSPVGETCNVFLAPGAPGASADEKKADCVDQRQLVVDVRNAGGSYESFVKKAMCPNGKSCFEHGKMVIADSQTALISTGNFDDTSLCIASESPSRCDRDYSLIDTDAALISTLEAIFEADLKGTAYDVQSLIPASLNNTLVVSPDSLTPIVNFIASATVSVEIETQYLEDTDMNAALVAAANRGVKVTVTTASACAFGKPTVSAASKITTIYTAFDKAGISSSMFNASNKINGRPGYLHAKVMVVDGTRAWVGSQNGSAESLTKNREYGVFLDNPTDVNFILGVMRADHTSANSETWRQSLTCNKD